MKKFYLFELPQKYKLQFTSLGLACAMFVSGCAASQESVNVTNEKEIRKADFTLNKGNRNETLIDPFNLYVLDISSIQQDYPELDRYLIFEGYPVIYANEMRTSGENIAYPQMILNYAYNDTCNYNFAILGETSIDSIIIEKSLFIPLNDFLNSNEFFSFVKSDYSYSDIHELISIINANLALESNCQR